LIFVRRLIKNLYRMDNHFCSGDIVLRAYSATSKSSSELIPDSFSLMI
jgi:hypothetical protein